MKIYIAGKLASKESREKLEALDSLCKSLGFQTFLPHRDVGICDSIDKVEEIFKKDITESLPSCDLVVANLNGISVGAGTAWELGYAYAKGIPCLALKTDEPKEEALDYLSAIILGSVEIFDSQESLKEKLKDLRENGKTNP